MCCLFTARAVQVYHFAKLITQAHRIAMLTRLVMQQCWNNTCAHDCWFEHGAKTLVRTTARVANQLLALAQGAQHSHRTTAMVACNHLETGQGTKQRIWSRRCFGMVLQKWRPGWEHRCWVVPFSHTASPSRKCVLAGRQQKRNHLAQGRNMTIHNPSCPRHTSAFDGSNMH